MNKSVSNISNSKENFKGFLSINDLREKEYSNVDLSPKERLAVKNFDRYRITSLSKKISDIEFHNCYQQLQVMANLSPYDEFLKEKYFL
jgi:hypothetical protein